MTLSDYTPIMRNDVSIDDKEVYNQHTNLIKSKKYLDAVKLLENNSQLDSVTASLLNSWECKIYELNNMDKPFYDPYLYSQTEPSSLGDKVIWQQEY